MRGLELSVDADTLREPQDQLKTNTYWFHIFKAMVDYELARLGPYAFAVYCVIKAHCDLKTGLSIPSIPTIASKAGISPRQAMREIKLLESLGYISRTRSRKHNEYKLTEKIVISDSQGRHRGEAQWEYRLAQVKNTIEELKRMLFNREAVGQGIHIENFQIIENQTNIGFQISQADLDQLAESNPDLYTKLLSLRNSIKERKVTKT
jgi:DNA-binding transcriptional regulator YhcF (GntR family)